MRETQMEKKQLKEAAKKRMLEKMLGWKDEGKKDGGMERQKLA